MLWVLPASLLTKAGKYFKDKGKKKNGQSSSQQFTGKEIFCKGGKLSTVEYYGQPKTLVGPLPQSVPTVVPVNIQNIHILTTQYLHLQLQMPFQGTLPVN